MWFSYLIVDLFIISFPLVASFEKRIQYYKKWKPLLMSLLFISSIYIIWDIIVTYIGHWSFNPLYTIDFHLLNLPLEEILFFITVPYSCIFIYEAILYFFGDKEIFFNKYMYTVIGILSIIISFIFITQGYTFIALIAFGLFFIVASWLYPQILKARAYWTYFIITLIPFIIVNFILTSTPIVLYNSNAIWGFRVTTIPLEDFFYNFSMLSLYLMVYLYFKKKWQIKSNMKSGSIEIGIINEKE